MGDIRNCIHGIVNPQEGCICEMYGFGYLDISEPNNHECVDCGEFRTKDAYFVADTEEDCY